jgi:hypothetical protein
MTQEQERLLNELLLNNVATKTFTLFEGKVVAIITSLTTDEQLQVEHGMAIVQGTPSYAIRIYSLRILSKVLKSYKVEDKEYTFTTPEQAEKFLRNQPGAVVEALVKKFSEFQKEIQEVISPDNLDQNFSGTSPTAAE